MSLVANFTGKAARSLGNKFLERAVIPANAATDGEVFESADMDSATRLAALEIKVDAVSAGGSSVNRNVVAAAERMGLGSVADLKKRDEEEFKARVLRNASEEFRERLAERIKGLQDEINRLNWEINRFREIERRYMQGGVDALLPEDHNFLQETVPDVYERITNPENIQKERELRAEADKTGDRSKLEAFQKEIAGFDKVIAEKKAEREAKREMFAELERTAEEPELLALTEDGLFKSDLLNVACKELGCKPEDVANDEALRTRMYEQLDEVISKIQKESDEIERKRSEQVELFESEKRASLGSSYQPG